MFSLFGWMRCWPTSRVVACKYADEYTAQNNDTKVFLRFLCCPSVFSVSCLSVSIKTHKKKIRHADRADGKCTEKGLIPCVHYWAWEQRRKTVAEDWRLLVHISRSKLHPYQDDLLYVRVINAHTRVFLRWLPQNMKHLCNFCRSQN